VELRHLRSFIALSEELHFGRTATRLHLAQPALSVQIRQLEREVGTPLFERASRGVSLTSAGLAFVDHARETVARADQALAAVRQQAAGVVGSLTVGVVAHGAAELTVPVLRAFAASRPAVHLQVVELGFIDQVARVADGTVDLAFVRPPLGDDRLELTPLFSEPRVAVVPAPHELAGAASVTVADLLPFDFLAADDREPQTWRDWWWLVPERGELPKVREPGRPATPRELLYGLVLTGAIATAPASMARYFPWPSVEYIPVDGLSPSQVALATRRGTSQPLTAHFRAVAAAVARGAPGLVDHDVEVTAATA